MNVVWPVIGVTLVAAAGGAHGWHQGMLPESVAEWKPAEQTRTVDRLTLFDYMNGAGELYLAYGFQELAVRRYHAPDQPDVTVEVYRMSGASDACGVFLHDHSPDQNPPAGLEEVGRDRDYALGLLRFWKGNYFVRAIAERETEAARAALSALGRSISDAISPAGEPPELLSLLPQGGMEPRSARYFHKHTVLNYYYYLADGNILRLSDRTEVAMARYRMGEDRPWLLVIRYPSAKDAARARLEFGRVYFSDRPLSASPQRVESVERGRFTGVAQQEKLVRLVFEAGSREQCLALLKPVPLTPGNGPD